VRNVRFVWQWIKDQVIREVSEEDAICEFDCRKQQCAVDQWETCERRRARGAGELLPPGRGRAVQPLKWR
jgi:hypothetical protein